MTGGACCTEFLSTKDTPKAETMREFLSFPFLSEKGKNEGEGKWDSFHARDGWVRHSDSEIPEVMEWVWMDRCVCCSQIRLFISSAKGKLKT
jgi:hypothetical protein